MGNNDFSRVLSLIESVGEYVLHWRNNQEARQVYSDAEFKTEADQRAHDMLCQGLNDLYPGTSIISEEVSDVTSISLMNRSAFSVTELLASFKIPIASTKASENLSKSSL